MSLYEYSSRRSVVHSVKGMTSSTQVLASAAGVKILEQGGNAAMAAVAMAAAMSVLEPSMTGLGGDAFALYYDAKTKKVRGINGSGKSPGELTVEMLRSAGVQGPRIPNTSPHSVTVPGAVRAWFDILEHWGNGKLTMAQILAPAIDLAESTPVQTISSLIWAEARGKLLKSKNGKELLRENGDSPKDGELFSNPGQLRVLKALAEEGPDVFYKGHIAEAIVDVLQEEGGVMTLDDLGSHKSLFLEPISVEYDGVKLYELPPNNQGLVALIALGIIKELDKRGTINLKSMKHNSAEYIHLISEVLKFAFKDGEEYIADPESTDVNAEHLLSRDYLSKRADLFNPEAVNPDFSAGVLDHRHSDTAYFTATDSEGNACSFIASLYMNMGSGIVPRGCGFALQNRGCNFSLIPGDRNYLTGGGKRPFHTIIPAMATKVSPNTGEEELYASYGVMGGFMQPQGHLQVFLNLKVFDMNPQHALDAPRICLNAYDQKVDNGKGGGSPLAGIVRLDVEDGISQQVVDSLESKGHKVKLVKGFERHTFGRGQLIMRNSNNKVYSAGSDHRGDGASIPEV